MCVCVCGVWCVCICVSGVCVYVCLVCVYVCVWCVCVWCVCVCGCVCGVWGHGTMSCTNVQLNEDNPTTLISTTHWHACYLNGSQLNKRSTHHATWLYPFHDTSMRPFTTRFNVTLTRKSESIKWPLPFMNTLTFSTLHATCSTHIIQLHLVTLITNICSIKIPKLHFMNFSPFSPYLLPLRV